MSGSQIGGIVGGVVGAWVGGPAGAQWGMAIGSAIGGYVDPEKIQGPRLTDAAQQTSRDGIPISWGFGRYPTTGNLIWIQPGPPTEHRKTERQGKGGPKVTTFTYTRSYCIGVCRGILNQNYLWDPIAGILIVKEFGKIVYDARSDSELYALGMTADEISASRGASAAFLAGVRIYLGGEAQLPDPTIEAWEGVGNTPAHRGLVNIVFVDKDVTRTEGAVSQYEFVVDGSGIPSEHDQILADGPVLYWKLNEGAGTTVIDYSGNGYHGTYYGDYDLHGEGGAEWGPTVRTGGAQRIGTEPIDIDVGSDGIFAVETVATITEHGSSASALFWKGESLSGLSNWRIWVRDVDNPPDYTLEGTTAPEIGLGSKHHYCITGDGTTVYRYIDGNLINSSPFAPIGTFDNRVSIGDSDYNDSYCWKGTQRNAAVFNKHLTAQQVALHAALGIGGVDGMPIPDAPGWYVNADGTVYTDGTYTVIDRVPVVVGSVVAHLLWRAGLSSDQYDVSQLTDVMDGYRIASEGGIDSYLSPLMIGYFFDVADWDGVVHCVKRGGNSVLTLTMDDLAARDGEALEWERIQEAELLRKQTVGYFDPAASYNSTAQDYERRVSTIQAKGESSIGIPVVTSATAAAQMAEKRVNVAWAETDMARMCLPVKFTRLTATDVVTVIDDDNVAHRIRLMKKEEDSSVLMFEAPKDRQSAYTGSVTGRTPNPPTPPVSALIGPTLMMVMNLPVLTEAHDELGFYVAGRGMLPGWDGAAIDLSTDAGATFSTVGEITESSVIGYTTTDLAAWDSSEYPSIQSVTVWLPYPPSSIDYETLLRYGNRAAIQLDSGDWSILQYQTVVANGNDSYTLSGLIQGRYNTTPGPAASGANFVLIDSTVQFIQAERWMLGETLTVRAVSFGTDPDAASTETFLFDEAASQTEWPPHFLVAERDVSDNVTTSCILRGRIGTETTPHQSQYFAGVRFTYTDGVDTISYDVTAVTIGTGPTAEHEYTAAQQTTDFGAPPSSLDITVAGLNEITGEGPSSTGITI